MESKRYNVHIPSKLSERLEEHCRAKGRRRGSVIQQALDEYLTREERADRQAQRGS